MKIEHTLEIAAPIERLWELTVAIEDWPAITPTVTALERLDAGPLGVGARARLKQPGSPARVWTVTALEPRRRFAWSARVLGCTMTATHELSETDAGTRNHLRVELPGWLGALLRRPIARALAQENRAFAQAAESAT